MMRDKSRTDGFKQPPLWKTLIVLLLVVAMPLFFSYYRSVMMQGTLDETASMQQPHTQQKPNATVSHTVQHDH